MARRFKAAIIGGVVDFVVALVSCLGHADWDAIRAACVRAKVPLIVVRGGTSAVRREVAAHL